MFIDDGTTRQSLSEVGDRVTVSGSVTVLATFGEKTSVEQTYNTEISPQTDTNCVDQRSHSDITWFVYTHIPKFILYPTGIIEYKLQYFGRFDCDIRISKRI